jgi:tRNA (cmo5U34)-methyltransferase
MTKTETPDGAKLILEMFSDPEAVQRYTDGPRRFVPGVDSLHRMSAILLAERAPPAARVLVLGAGGGMELRAFADAQPGWTFVGVDPAEPMLKLARQTMGPHAERAELVAGYINDAPLGPFDAAACLLTLHFLDAAERLRTLKELRRRLAPGAPLVVAHGSFPQDGEDRDRWLARYAAFAVASGADPQQADAARKVVSSSVNMMAPEEDERLLAQAGFSGVELFYSAFTWRGWVAYA